jgi:hypothetical protein
MRYSALLLLACFASIPLIHAQTPISSLGQTASATIPADPSFAAAPSNASAAPADPVPDVPAAGTGGAASASGQAPAQLAVPSDGANANPPQWNRSMLDPFQTGPGFGNFSGSAGGRVGFNGAGIPGGADRLGAAGFNRFGAASMGGSTGNFAPLFPASAPGAIVSGRTIGPFAASTATSPSLNQLIHGSLKLPLNSGVGAFRLTYLDTIHPGSNIGDLVHPFASAMFSTSDLGNGMVLSAGTFYGNRSMAGAPAASLGNGPGGAKHSGPALAIKLSF